MNSTRVYLGLGSNIGDSIEIIQRTCAILEHTPGIQLLGTSSLYRTTAVSPIPQRDFINAACAIETLLSPQALYDTLHRIEVLLGKTPKEKNAPRLIDIDILFFGTTWYQTAELCIPHARWKERLFVLQPLSDLVETICFPLDAQGRCETLHLPSFLKIFSNPHKERFEKINPKSHF